MEGTTLAMVIKSKEKLAVLLRAAAREDISELDFWDQFKRLADPSNDSIAALAYATATHYWGNFHSRNLLLMKVKPDPYQMQQGQEELNLIADGIEGDWPVSDLTQKLRSM